MRPPFSKCPEEGGWGPGDRVGGGGRGLFNVRSQQTHRNHLKSRLKDAYRPARVGGQATREGNSPTPPAPQSRPQAAGVTPSWAGGKEEGGGGVRGSEPLSPTTAPQKPGPHNPKGEVGVGSRLRGAAGCGSGGGLRKRYPRSCRVIYIYIYIYLCIYI